VNLDVQISMHYIARSNLPVFLDALRNDYKVFVPVKKDSQRFYREYTGKNEMVIGEVRPFEPLKSFFVRAREVVADGFKPDVLHAEDKPFCIVGVKACDLRGLKIQDHVFKNHDYPDPFYLKLREHNFIISADCTCALETCFCLALGVKPQPQEDYDMNLSEISNGFVVEAATAKARALLERHPRLFQEATNEQLTQRDAQRLRVMEAVERNLCDKEIPHQDSFGGIIQRQYDSDIWGDEAKTCVECGACTIICPTCHCFLLYDQEHEGTMKRLRSWDSCMIKDYARVAGGANPRPKLWMRLRNRFEKKFDFFPRAAGVYACTGCGRCISACPAKIDIRKVLRKLVANV